MQVKYTRTPRICTCGRSNDHEHKTMERYQVLEMEGGEVVSEGYMHGYDGEDDHIYQFIKDVEDDQREAGQVPTYHRVTLIRVDKV